MQSILTGLKVGAIAVIILLGYVLVKGLPGGPATLAAPTGHRFVASFGVAMVGAFWAYEGWNACTFAAGEVKRPERNVPLALILGTVAVIALYLALNLVYYHVLPMDQVARSSRVGADAAVRIFGHTGSYLVSLLIIISTLGSLNGSILAAPRVYYAMARDGLFFRWCARVHPRFHTPHVALLVQGVWAIVLVAAGTYEQLFTYVIFAAFVFYALTALAVVVLRRTRPDAPAALPGLRVSLRAHHFRAGLSVVPGEYPDGRAGGGRMRRRHAGRGCSGVLDLEAARPRR